MDIELKEEKRDMYDYIDYLKRATRNKNITLMEEHEKFISSAVMAGYGVSETEELLNEIRKIDNGVS